MLKETFINLLTNNSDNRSLVSELWTEIEQNYSNKKRHYHTLSHLDNLLNQLTEVKDKIINWETLLFTLYYHDIVYNALQSDNEEKSAELAEKRMKQISVPNQIIENCKTQILATKKHLDNSEIDTNYFTDADLSVLGLDEISYKEYSKLVRKEFLYYPSIIYNKGRVKVLEHFLSLKRIYKTEYFFHKYENQARENIKKEIRTLNGVRNELFLETTNRWSFNIEEDGNWYEFFQNGVEILENTKGVEKITYYSGFFDSGYYRFYYNKVKLNLEYDGMLGVDLRTEPNPTENDLDVAKIVYELLKTVRNQNYT